MAITVDVGSNPVVKQVGTTNASAVIINSGRPTTDREVTYEIEQRDGQPHWQDTRNRGDRLKITLSSFANAGDYADVVSVDKQSIQLALKDRTRYKARIRWRVAGAATTGAWSAWTLFETRDKHYKTPDAIIQERVADDTNPISKKFPNKKVKKRIVIQNKAKASTKLTARGATVTNSDLGYNGTTSITRAAGGTPTSGSGNVTVVNTNYYNQRKAATVAGTSVKQPV